MIKAAAKMLELHPGLLIRIEGHARPQARAMYGRPLSQARATSLRKALLEHLYSKDAAERHVYPRIVSAFGADEPSASAGVRAGGYSEGDDFVAVTEYYTVRSIGTRVEALGVWLTGSGSEADGRALYELMSYTRDGQCASIMVAGFQEPTVAKLQEPNTPVGPAAATAVAGAERLALEQRVVALEKELPRLQALEMGVQRVHALELKIEQLLSLHSQQPMTSPAEPRASEETPAAGPAAPPVVAMPEHASGRALPSLT